MLRENNNSLIFLRLLFSFNCTSSSLHCTTEWIDDGFQSLTLARKISSIVDIDKLDILNLCHRESHNDGMNQRKAPHLQVCWKKKYWLCMCSHTHKHWWHHHYPVEVQRFVCSSGRMLTDLCWCSFRMLYLMHGKFRSTLNLGMWVLWVMNMWRQSLEHVWTDWSPICWCAYVPSSQSADCINPKGLDYLHMDISHGDKKHGQSGFISLWMEY